MEALIADALPLLGGVLGIAPSVQTRAKTLLTSGELTVATVDTIAGLEALEREWQALETAEGSATTPFQTYRFHREWVRHFIGPDVTFEIVTVRSDGLLVVILPLAIRRTSLGTIAGWMGDPLIQYGDVICAPGADPSAWLDAALEALKLNGRISVLMLRRIRADSPAAAWYRSRMSAVGAGDEAIAVDLSEFSDHRDFAQSRPSRAARNRRRKRKLAERGKVEFRVIEDSAEAARLVRKAVALKRQWLDKRGLMGRAFADDRTLAFLEALAVSSAEDRTESGAVIICLDVGGEPASIEYALRHNNNHCALLGAFEQDLARFSPGHLQMQTTIEWCIDNGTAVYDLMAPADTYKRELGNLSVPVRDYSTLLSLTGLPASLLSNYGPRSAKAAFELLPRRLRATIRSRLG